jgi:dTDP-4-dehydrorhamnose reductase
MAEGRRLVTGAKGMLGTDLCRLLAAQGEDFVAADLAELDLTDPVATSAFVRECAPATILNCAAYTAVDQAETNRELAFRVNRDGARNLAVAAAEVGATMLHISTDYVFDGSKQGAYLEDDPPHPLGVYGASKWEGEEAVREALAEHYIVRTAWLYGIHGKSFPRTILGVAAQGKPLRVVHDQQGCPTYTVHLAQALLAIVTQPHYGTFHAVNTGTCTWYDLARAAVAEAGLEVEITPVTTAEYPRPAPRPANSVLSTDKLASVHGVRLPAWQEGLREFVSLWRQEPR